MISHVKYLGPPQSGSIAAQTFSRNPFGQYARARVGRGGVPVYSIAGAVAAWQALSLQQQRGWQAWADQILRPDSLGVQRSLSGVQRFISAWLLLTISGGSAPADPPASRLPVVAVFNLTASSVTTQQMRLAFEISGDGYLEVQTVQPFSSPGTTFPPGRGAYWVSSFPGFFVAGAIFQDRLYSLPPTPKRFFGRVRVINLNGIPGPWAYSGPSVLG